MKRQDYLNKQFWKNRTLVVVVQALQKMLIIYNGVSNVEFAWLVHKCVHLS